VTDTPRTRDEILDLYADDLSPVSRQDLRDFVVSTMFDSSDSHGFYVVFGSPLIVLPASSDTAHFGQAVPIVLTDGTPSSSSTIPEEWLDSGYTLAASDPNNSWSIEWTPGCGMMLPYGVYDVQVYTFYDAIAGDGGYVAPVQCFMDQAEFDPDLPYPIDRTQPYVYAGYYNGGSVGSEYGVMANHDSILATLSRQVITNDEPMSKPFIVIAYTVGFASPVNVTGVQLTINKVG
jgi:hypothetical protein